MADSRQRQEQQATVLTQPQPSPATQQAIASLERQRAELAAQQSALAAQQAALSQQQAEAERRRVAEARRQEQQRSFDTSAQGLMAWAKDKDEREAAAERDKRAQENAKVQQFEAQRQAARATRSSESEPLLYVNSASPLMSAADAARKAAERPGALNIGMVGLQGTSAQATRAFVAQLNDAVVIITYRAMAKLAQDLTAGLVDMACVDQEAAKEHLQTAAVRSIGHCR